MTIPMAYYNSFFFYIINEGEGCCTILFLKAKFLFIYSFVCGAPQRQWDD